MDQKPPAQFRHGRQLQQQPLALLDPAELKAASSSAGRPAAAHKFDPQLAW